MGALNEGQGHGKSWGHRLRRNKEGGDPEQEHLTKAGAQRWAGTGKKVGTWRGGGGIPKKAGIKKRVGTQRQVRTQRGVGTSYRGHREGQEREKRW